MGLDSSRMEPDGARLDGGPLYGKHRLNVSESNGPAIRQIHIHGWTGGMIVHRHFVAWLKHRARDANVIIIEFQAIMFWSHDKWILSHGRKDCRKEKRNHTHAIF